MPRTDAPLAPPSSSSCNVASRISSSVRARRGPGRLRLLGAATGRLLRLTSFWTAYSICTTYKICTALRDRLWDDRDPSSLSRPCRRAAGPADHHEDPPASDAPLATRVAQASGGPAALRRVGHREPHRLGIPPGWLHGMGPAQHIPYHHLGHLRRLVHRRARCIDCPENLPVRRRLPRWPWSTGSKPSPRSSTRTPSRRLGRHGLPDDPRLASAGHIPLRHWRVCQY